MTTAEHERDTAERKAFEALARYKFQMFGYWAAIWVHMNHLCAERAPSPFKDLVKAARGSKHVVASEIARHQKEAGL